MQVGRWGQILAGILDHGSIETGLESGWEVTEGVGRIRKQGGHLTLLALGRRSLRWLLGPSAA